MYLLILLVIVILIIAYFFMNREGFFFEVTPEKKCRLFPYAWSDQCYKLYKEGRLNKNVCTTYTKQYPWQVFTGRGRFYYDYTPESNSSWINERCIDDKYKNICIT